MNMNNELRLRAMANGTPRHADATEHADGSLLRDDSDRMSRVISQISNDSIRQLMKIASMGFEEDFVLDDIDLTDICQSWDIPMSPEEETPIDLQREVDIMRQQVLQDLEQEAAEMPQYDVDMQLDEPSFDPAPAPYEFSPHQMTIGDMNESGPLMDRQPAGGMEHKFMPEMDVQRPRVSLVLDSNVVRLDSRFCPKPSVTILPSQVIHAPEMPSSSPQIQPAAAASFRNWMIQPQEYDWTMQQQQPQMPVAANYGDTSTGYMQTMQNNASLNGEFSRMMMESSDHPFMAVRPRGMESGSQFISPQMFERRDVPAEDEARNKVIRKNTEGEKAPAVSFAADQTVPMTKVEQEPQPLVQRMGSQLIESRSAEIRKIQSMTEADICDYVKSMAPQLQDNAWEEIVRETNFQERLEKAKQKMQEHADEMDRIRRDVEKGRLDPKVGHEMMRKVYNRREAAASRTKREQGLVKAAFKKRTLEKICSWMREHLFGNSELFSANSMDSDVRRSRSDGTKSLL